MLRKKQEVGGKIGHDEYTYYLGDPNIYTQDPAIRGQGDIQRGGPGQVGPGNVYHKRQSDARPPWGINADDVPRNQRQPAGNNNNYGPVVPAAGKPSQGGGGGGRQPNSNSPQASPYGPPVVPQDAWLSPSPYSPGQPQPAVTAFSPVVGSHLPPVQPLTGVLPPIYRPKPPLSFQNAPPVMPSASPYYTPSAMAPMYYPGPGGAGPYLQAPMTPRGPYFGAPAEIEMTPTKQSPQNRPTSSPAGFLPPLYGDQDPAGGPPRAGRRRSSGSQIPGLGGGVGGGDDDDDDRRAQQDARRRAQQLQDENARLMAEQKRRKEEAHRRQLDEDLVEERRLQKEREAVAKRELAEVEREREEREMKMMGPAAYAAKKRQEEQQKRAQTPSPPVETTPAAPASNPSADVAPTSGNSSFSRPQAAPYQQAPLFAPPNAVAPQGSNTSATSYTFLNPQAPPLSQAMVVNGSQRTTYSYETDHLKAELRQIADEQRRLERIIAESLRANQATASATLRAVAAQNAGTRVSVGAGTYLTDTITPLSSAARAAGHPSSLAPVSNTRIYRSALSAGNDAQGAGAAAGSPPSSSSWLEAYLKPNAAFPSCVAGTAPPPASTSGLGWANMGLADPTRAPPSVKAGMGSNNTNANMNGAAPGYLGNNANRYVSGSSGGAGISVLASQIHASTADWSASRNRSVDPEDLSYEPSTFVGPVVPSQPRTGGDTDGVSRDGADVAPAPAPIPNAMPAAAMTSPPSFILQEPGDAAPGLDSKGGTPRPGSNSSILKKGGSPRVGAIPTTRAGPPSVRWDEL